jgi:hypothetical protein
MARPGFRDGDAGQATVVAVARFSFLNHDGAIYSIGMEKGPKTKSRPKAASQIQIQPVDQAGRNE